MNHKNYPPQQKSECYNKKKSLSEYVFPLHQKFGINQEKSFSKFYNKIHNIASKRLKSSSIQASFSRKNESDLDSFRSISTVSQKQRFLQCTQTIKSQYRTFYGKIPSKNVSMYKKKLSTNNMGNIHELNVTSLVDQTNKIISTRLRRLKKIDLSQYGIKSARQKQQVKIIHIQNSNQSKKLPKLTNCLLSTNYQISKTSRNQIKWQESLKTINNINNKSSQRKNSICPWQDQIK